MFHTFKFAAAAAFGVAGMAQAAPVGGASLDISGVFLSTPTTTPEAGLDLSLSGSFVAENDIDDFDAVLPYEALAVVSAGAPLSPLTPLFGATLPLGSTSINALIGDVGALFGAPGLDVDDLVGLAAPFLIGPDDMGDFLIEDTLVAFTIDAAPISASAIAGDFTLSAFITSDEATDLSGLIDDLFGAPSLPEAFAFEINLEIAPAAVPAPAALPLVLTGLFALGVVGRRRRNRS